MAEETAKTETEVKEKLPCTVCQLEFTNQSILDAHLTGSKHQKKILANQLLKKLQQTEKCFTHDAENGTFLCLVCNIEVTSPQLLETHFSGNKHKNKASLSGGNQPQQPLPSSKQQQQPVSTGKTQPTQQSTQPQQTTNGQAGKRQQLNTAAPPAKRVAPVEGEPAPETQTFTCNDCQKTFNSEVQMTQHLSSKKHLNRCLIAMFGTCNIQDTLTKSTRGRGGRGNNRGRGRGRGSGGGGRGRSNYQTSSEWETNGYMRNNSQIVDYRTNGVMQPTPDCGGCSCGNRGRVQVNQVHQQRAYPSAWEDNYDNMHYTSQGGFSNHGGYSDDSTSYLDQNSVTSNTYTNPNHYSSRNIYSDQSVSSTQVQSRSRSTGVNRVGVHDRVSGGQSSYQQRGNGEQGWNKGGQTQGGSRGYQGGGRGRGRGRGYQSH